MKKKKKKIEPICGNCRLFDGEREVCKVTILINEQKYNMPVFPKDNCHMDALGIEIKQIRWWSEDPQTGKKTEGEGVIKMEYPEDLKLWHGFLKGAK